MRGVRRGRAAAAPAATPHASSRDTPPEQTVAACCSRTSRPVAATHSHSAPWTRPHSASSTTLLRGTRRNVISPLLKGAAARFGLSLLRLWDSVPVLAARGLVSPAPRSPPALCVRARSRRRGLVSPGSRARRALRRPPALLVNARTPHSRSPLSGRWRAAARRTPLARRRARRAAAVDALAQRAHRADGGVDDVGIGVALAILRRRRRRKRLDDRVRLRPSQLSQSSSKTSSPGRRGASPRPSASCRASSTPRTSPCPPLSPTCPAAACCTARSSLLAQRVEEDAVEVAQVGQRRAVGQYLTARWNLSE